MRNVPSVVLAHPDFPRQSPESRKMVVVVVIYFYMHEKHPLIVSHCLSIAFLFHMQDISFHKTLPCCCRMLKFTTCALPHQILIMLLPLGAPNAGMVD